MALAARCSRPAPLALREQLNVNSGRKDSTVQTGRIFDVLNARFPDQVFQDVESTDIGVDRTDELRESVLVADVLIAVIGPEWQSMVMERGPRINDPADYVHIGVRTALEHDSRIIPVLLQGGETPSPDWAGSWRIRQVNDDEWRSLAAVLPGGFPQSLHIADRRHAKELFVLPVKV